MSQDTAPADQPEIYNPFAFVAPAAAEEHFTAAGALSPFPLFYDSCAKQYPASARRIVVYVDAGGGPAECIGYPPDRGRYHIHAITREGYAAAASRAQIIDYEWTLRAYENPGAAREWAETRAAHGERFITYCPRALLRPLLAELGNCLWTHPNHYFWIPTLDGRQWTPTELADNIVRGWHVDVPSSRIWGNQFAQAGPRGTRELEWDESSLFLPW
jgi:hypothetical protein